MAYGFVQSSNILAGSSALTNVFTLGQATTVNNLVVVNIRYTSTTPTVTNVTDSAGNTYVLAAGPIDQTVRMYQYYGVQTTGGATTVTVTYSTSTQGRVIIEEYSGTARTNASVIDKTVSTTSSGTSLTFPIVPAAVNELIVAAIQWNTGATSPSSNTGYTIPASVGTNFGTGYKLGGSVSEGVQFSWTTSNPTTLIVSAFNPAPPSVTGLSSIKF